MKIPVPGHLVAGGLILLAAVGLAAAPLAFAVTPTVQPFDISGTWKGTAKTQGVSGGVTLRLLQSGSAITGTVVIKSTFIKSCAKVTGTLTGTFSNGVFDTTMETPHVNPFTCAITGQDVSVVALPLSSNVKMSGSFQQFVPELGDAGQTVTIVLSLTKISGMITETDPDGPGPAVDLGSSQPGAHDLAVTKILAPKALTRGAADPPSIALVRVEIQNRSQHDETIPDLATLGDLVTLTCTPVGSCTPPVAALHSGKPQKTLPVTLKPKQKLKVVFDVPIDCAFNPDKNLQGDYTWSAEVDHAALDTLADDHPEDDVCPRTAAAPYDFDHYPDGTIKDKGAGGKLADKTLGGTILTDVVVK